MPTNVPTPEKSPWVGRVDSADGPLAVRWHQRVKPLARGAEPGVALLGFACDEGVRRNGGRVGAAGGPRAIREVLANLAWHNDRPVFDAGDVACPDGKLEAAQDRLKQAVCDAIFARQRPLVLGGGHETAWGSFRGLTQAAQRIDPNLKAGVINIDAHFDLRADSPGNSGTVFAQVAKWCSENDRLFRYLALGVSEPSNTAGLFDRARRFGVEWRLDTDLIPWRLDDTLAAVVAFATSLDVIHLSIDLDVLPAAVMPAVSAPAARGVPLEAVEAIVAAVLPTGKVCVTDVVELNPAVDPDGRGAQTAARLVWQIAKNWPLLVSE
jgi:formiminoglutamase